jgi:hypothetical protein
MAYKFQLGSARLSGSTTFEEAVTVEDALAANSLSSSGVSTLHQLSLDRSTIQEVDINGGAIDGATVGAASQAAGKFTTLSASSTLNVEGVSSFGPAALASISAAGVFSGSGVSTLHRLGADRAALVEVNIDGGAIDGTVIGANSQAAGQFSTLSASGQVDLAGAVRLGAENQTTVSAVGVLSSSAQATLFDAVLDRATIESVDINGGAIDGTPIGASSQAAGQFSTLSASGQVDLAGLVNLGAENQTTVSGVGVLSSSATATLFNADLDRATIHAVDINGGAIDGTVIGAASQAAAQFSTLSASGQVNLPGEVRFGVDNQTTVGAAGILSSSATATLFNIDLDRATIQSVDINGGAIDGTVIGAASQAAGQFSTLSASGQVNLPGEVRFGTENQTSIGPIGALSSSADATIFSMTLDRLAAGTANIDGGSVDGATVGASVQSSGKFTTLSASSTLAVAGTSRFMGDVRGDGGLRFSGIADGDMAVGSDRLFFNSGSTGRFRNVTVADFLSAIAGAGLSVQNAQLKTDAGGVNEVTPQASDAVVSLSEGTNYFDADLTASAHVKLPASVDVGSVVTVKAKGGVSATNFIAVSSSTNDEKIDGLDEVLIESPFGAITCVYVKADQWRII